MKETYPIEDESDFKGWRLARPNASRLLKEIVFRWRRSNIRIPGKRGRWAVWPIDTYCDDSGLSRNQVERAMKELVATGLILRERHRFGGVYVRAHIQPTALALTYGGRPQDLARIAATSDGTSDGTGDGTGDGTDHTYVSSNQAYLPKSGVADSGNASKAGKLNQDSFGEEEMVPKAMVGASADIWGEAHVECFPGVFVELAPVHKKMLADFGAMCPPGFAGNIIDCIVRDWAGFITKAKSDAAAFKCPDRPTVPFALKFVEPAVNFWLAKNDFKWNAETETVEAKPVASMPTPKPSMPVQCPQEKHQPATFEEVKAILNDDAVCN